MFKKRIYVFFYVFLVALFSVYLCFKIQERDLIIQLNNHNLSSNTYRVTLRQNTTLYDLNQKIEDSGELGRVQIHYQDCENRNVTYFYGKGSFTAPPMLSGHFFSDSDFKSNVATVVVGKNWQNRLYRPKDQAYLKWNGRYVPVIGIMGDEYSSDLDNQVFISLSTDQLRNAYSNNYRILIDGPEDLKAGSIRKALGTSSVKHQVTNHFIVSDESWLASHWAQALGIIMVIVLMLGEIVFWIITSKRSYNETIFLKVDMPRFIFAEWRAFSICIALGLGLGGMAGTMIYNLTTVVPVACFLGGMFVVSSGLFYLLLRHQMKND